VRKIVFITGTRADYGKLKALIRKVEESADFEAYVYVSGMHLLEAFGNTYNEILKDGYKNIYIAYGLVNSKSMSYNVGDVVCHFTGYVQNVQPDLIVVHGDRGDALAGAIVGALNNIRVVHIEGGELSGTIDESIRHAVSKLAHIHLVCNSEAKKRLIQLGEQEERIYVLGSPDIDIMNSENLPSMQEVRERYDIRFEKYGILMYHPVTTEHHVVSRNIKSVISAVTKSGHSYVIIYPNNDFGSEIIINEYKKLEKEPGFRIFPSIRFEYFLTLLKHAEFMLGNSSAGIRETGVYGVPAIDLGSRQLGRYNTEISKNVQHVNEEEGEILEAMKRIEQHRYAGSTFGFGDSAKRFMEILEAGDIWKQDIQKYFIDICLETVF
jgi:UDP-N-acetylglucosamine 2-epimerase (hydrolysing)